MFLYAIIIAVIIGFILKGSLNELGKTEVKGIYLIALGFGIEVVLHFMGQNKMLSIGVATYIVDLLMYLLLFIFVYLNRKNMFILIIGLGFLLNAVAIFSNGGVMPVSPNAMEQVSIAQSASSEGLYKIVDANTNLKFLCDILPNKLLGNSVVSIGDIISAVGIVIFIVTSMRGKILRSTNIQEQL